MAAIVLQKTRQNKFYDKSRPVNVLQSNLPVTEEYQSAMEAVIVPPVSGSISGVTSTSSIVQWNIPPTGHLFEVYILVTLTAPGGGGAYTTFPGLALISTLEIQHNGTSVVPQIQNYPQFLATLINSEFRDKQRAIVLAQLGTAAAGGTMRVPLWTPWSSFWNKGKSGGHVPPLPLDALQGQITFRVGFNTPTAITLSGTAGTMSGDMYIERILTKDAGKVHNWMTMGISPKIGPATALTANTLKRFQVNWIVGDIKQVNFHINTTAAGADPFAGMILPTSLQFFIDGNSTPTDPIITPLFITQMLHKREYELSSTAGWSDTFSWDPTEVTGPLDSAIGSLTIRDGTYFEVNMSAASNSNVFVIGLARAWYVISDGKLVKQE